MKEQPKSLDLQIRDQLDKDSVQETKQPFEIDPAVQAQERFDQWLAHLKRRHPMESERKLKEAAARYACLNRKERRKVFGLSSPKLPRFMTTIKGKR